MLLYLVAGYSNRFFATEQATSEISPKHGAIPKFVLAGDPRERSMFIHSGIVHIAGNMIFLYIYLENQICLDGLLENITYL
jgi:membrane associated rhomboid family serine protease